MNLTEEFEEFVHLLLAYLHDEALFSPQRLSKIRAECPPKNFAYFDTEDLQSRQRYMFFHGKICLVLDQDCYGDVKDSDSTLFPYHLFRHRLGIILSKSVDEDYEIDNLYKSISINTNHIPYYSILNGRARLETRLQNYQSHRSSFILILDLPTHLNLMTANTTVCKERMQLLIDFISFNLESMQRMLDGQSLRELDPVSTYEDTVEFLNQTCKILSELNSEYAIEVKTPHNVSGSYSLNMNIDLAKLSFTSYDSSWQFNLTPDISPLIHSTIANRFIRQCISRAVSLDQFKSEDHMLDLMQKIVKYLKIMYLDVNKCVDCLDFMQSYK